MSIKLREMSIARVREWMRQSDREQVLSCLPLLKQDQRSGVQQLVHSWEQREQKYQEQLNHWKHINQQEEQLRSEGYQHIAGIDEVGRGPLAGPLVIAAVVLPEDFYLLGINDSKKLSKENREEYASYIRQKARAIAIHYVQVEEIEQWNIYQATLRGMGEAVRKLAIPVDFALIDAMPVPLTIPSLSLIKGDQKSVSIAAASIIAKVERDRWMTEVAAVKYPAFGFERHMGYGTPEHLKALHTYGATPLHRQSFLTNQMELFSL